MAWWNKLGKQSADAGQTDSETAAGLMKIERDKATSLKNLEAGGLPVPAIDRIAAENQREKRRFSSDLSVNELLLTHRCGYEPVSQVIGSSIYHVGWQVQPYYSSTELTIITHAYYHARSLALSRMQQEAKLLGAHGVVGVRIVKNSYSWGENLLEFMAVGTAIRLTGSRNTETPFLSDLSGQDFWALHVNGFRPVGICYGNCAWYQVASWATQAAQNPGSVGYGYGYGTSYINQELTDFSQAVSHARHIAMQRMEAEIKTFGGEGIVGVCLDDEITPWTVAIGNDQERTDLMVRFHAFGTAISHYEQGLVEPIDYTLQLSD